MSPDFWYMRYIPILRLFRVPLLLSRVMAFGCGRGTGSCGHGHQRLVFLLVLAGVAGFAAIVLHDRLWLLPPACLRSASAGAVWWSAAFAFCTWRSVSVVGDFGFYWVGRRLLSLSFISSDSTGLVLRARLTAFGFSDIDLSLWPSPFLGFRSFLVFRGFVCLF